MRTSERGDGLDWEKKTDQAELHGACHAVRGDSNLGGLVAMLATILDTDPAYDFWQHGRIANLATPL